jgi:two-component system, cell cycle sensor histidine kinase and response regulator CckA
MAGRQTRESNMTGAHPVREAQARDIPGAESVAPAAAVQGENLTEACLNIAGTMFVVLDSEGRVSRINRKGCDILGYREDDIVGRNWFDACVPKRNRPQVKRAYQRLMAGQMQNVEYHENPVLMRDGRVRLVAWHNALLYNAEGAVVGTASSGQDVTDRKEAEATRQQRERAEAVGQLAAGVARSFSEVLGTLTGELHDLMATLLPHTTAHRRAERIGEAAQQAHDLTRRLMSVARAAEAGAHAPREPLSLADCVTDARALVQQALSARGVRMETLNPEDMPYVMANHSQFVDALVNVLLNAIEAAPRGSCVVVKNLRHCHRLESHRKQGRHETSAVGVCIHSECPCPAEAAVTGAAAAGAEDTATTVGLGLSVAQTLAQSMGGWIETIQSEKGLATHVCMPKARRPVSRSLKTAAAPKGLLLVVADDDPEALAVMQQTLEGAGHTVLAAPTGDQALVLYREHQGVVGAAIVDFLLPLEDGSYLLDRILQDHADARVLVTSGFSRDYVRGQNGSGSWAFLQKPFEPEHLLEAVSSILEL